jgi:hypothetical protein
MLSIRKVKYRRTRRRSKGIKTARHRRKMYRKSRRKKLRGRGGERGRGVTGIETGGEGIEGTGGIVVTSPTNSEVK